jgi:formylglycine-generating enzyme
VPAFRFLAAVKEDGPMSSVQRTPLWKRWWVWCAVCLALVGVAVNETQRLRDAQTALGGDWLSWLSSAVGNSPEVRSSKAREEPPLADAASDAKMGNTTGDSQVDAYLRGEMRRWQEDFGFDETVLGETVRRSVHAFRPFLLFRGGREAVQEVCRDAHDDADRKRRRLNRGGQTFGRAGREDTVQRGTYLLNSIEEAAADWLQDKTLENVDPEVPRGGWPQVANLNGAESHAAGGTLHVARGTVVNASGRLIWPGRPDLPASVNARLAAALMEWVDEFHLSEDDVPPLSRAVLSRLLVLQPGPAGQTPGELARTHACEAGIQWLRAARDEARPFFSRTGWVNVPHVVRLSSESTSRDVEAERESQITQTGASDSPALRPLTASNSALSAVRADLSVESADRPAALAAPFDASAAKSARAWWSAGLKLPTELTNSLGAKLVLIPAGEFYMGSTPLEIGQVRRIDPTFKKEWEQEEQPQHRVRISRPFYLDVHEVTRKEFAQFVRATGYQTDAKRDGKGGCGFDAATGEFRQDPVYDWQNPGFSQNENEPVVNVSWNDATAFCEWLSRKEKAVYRLPTEAEWEYACRAGTTSLFYTGDEPESLTTVGNVADGTLKAKFANWTTIGGRDGYAFTAPVGSFQPNGFGLFDMHGNVWEWCQDWYASGYYAKSPENDPQGPLRGSVRVFRGGSWYDAADLCRSAFRYWDVPTYRDYFLGFRIVAVPHGK